VSLRQSVAWICNVLRDRQGREPQADGGLRPPVGRTRSVTDHPRPPHHANRRSCDRARRDLLARGSPSEERTATGRFTYALRAPPARNRRVFAGRQGGKGGCWKWIGDPRIPRTKRWRNRSKPDSPENVRGCVARRPGSPTIRAAPASKGATPPEGTNCQTGQNHREEVGPTGGKIGGQPRARKVRGCAQEGRGQNEQPAGRRRSSRRRADQGQQQHASPGNPTRREKRRSGKTREALPRPDTSSRQGRHEPPPRRDDRDKQAAASPLGTIGARRTLPIAVANPAGRPAARR